MGSEFQREGEAISMVLSSQVLVMNVGDKRRSKGRGRGESFSSKRRRVIGRDKLHFLEERRKFVI